MTQPVFRPLALIVLFAIGSQAWAHKADGHDDIVLAAEKQELACGRKGAIPALTRSVDIALDLTAPIGEGELEVRQGETVRLAFVNKSSQTQAFLLGRASDIQEYTSLVGHYPDRAVRSPNILRLAAGQKDQLIWQFTQVGEFHVYALGQGAMGRWQTRELATVKVTPSPSPSAAEGAAAAGIPAVSAPVALAPSI